VVEPGQLARNVYLPQGSGWYDFWTGAYFSGSQEIVLPAPWDHPPLLAKAGCAIPLNLAEQHFSKRDDLRGFAVWPDPDRGQFECECLEDDGESEAYREGHFWIWRLGVNSGSSRISVDLGRSGEIHPGVDRVSLLFRRQERRPIDVQGGSIVRESERGTMRELLVTLQ
jgi:alpha-glucosidase